MRQEWLVHIPREDRVTHLWVTVFGATGENGLNGKTKEHAAAIQTLSDRLAKRELLESQVRTVWRTLQWVALAVATMVGFMMSGPVAGFLGNLIRAGLK